MSTELADEFSAAEPDPPAVVERRLSRFHDLGRRSVTGFSLFFGLIFLSMLGPAYLTLLVLFVQLCFFWELSGLRPPPDRRTLTACWGIFLAGVLFFYAHSFHDRGLTVEWRPLALLVEHCRAVFAPLYLFFFAMFVLGLREPLLQAQMWLLVMTHAALIVAACFSLANPIIYRGVAWWLMSVVQVVTNDAGAMIFGRMLGRRPLFALSPKKTREGFLGAMLTTLLFTGVFALWVRAPAFAFWRCSHTRVSFTPFAALDCAPDAAFAPGPRGLSPFELHALVCALFACFGAPFGGFFSSAVKRSLGLARYSNLLPGHGGVADRFDCQWIMNVFLYCYLFGGLYRRETSLARAESLARRLPPEALAALGERLWGVKA